MAKGPKGPLWVMGNSPSCERLIEVYNQRMKIEQGFRDSKSLLNLEKVMNKKREQLEITLALVFLAYGLGLMIGEVARDEAFGGDDGKQTGEKGSRRKHRKWGLYSGLFVLLKKRLRFEFGRWQVVLRRALEIWRRRLFPPLPGSV